MKKLFAFAFSFFALFAMNFAHAVEPENFVTVEMKVTKGALVVSDSVVLHSSYVYPEDAPPALMNAPIYVFEQDNPKIKLVRSFDTLKFQIEDPSVQNWQQVLSQSIPIKRTTQDQNVKLGPYTLEYRVVDYKY